jgi:hypothetical protein
MKNEKKNLEAAEQGNIEAQKAEAYWNHFELWNHL